MIAEDAPVYELREFFLVTEIFDTPTSAPNDDYNVVRYKSAEDKGYVNAEFSSYEACLEYMRECEKPGIVFQVQKIFRRVLSTNQAYIMAIQQRRRQAN